MSNNKQQRARTETFTIWSYGKLYYFDLEERKTKEAQLPIECSWRGSYDSFTFDDTFDEKGVYHFVMLELTIYKNMVKLVGIESPRMAMHPLPWCKRVYKKIGDLEPGQNFKVISCSYDRKTLEYTVSGSLDLGNGVSRELVISANAREFVEHEKLDSVSYTNCFN